MPWGAVIGAVASVAGGAMGADASRSAANKQADAAAAADAAARKEREPWTNAGKTALDQLTAGTQPGGQFAQKFSMADATNSDAEKFALSEGLGALNNSAAAKGGLLGTNNQQQNIKYAENVAGSFQNQAFNQWLSQQQQLMQPLQSLAGQGFTSASQTADTSANALLAAGGAQAGGAMGAAGAWGNAAGQVGNSLLANQDSLKKLFGSGDSGGGSTSLDSGGWLGGSATAGDYSDVRLKEDVVHVGTTNDGLPIYRYKMKSGGPAKMGVMAQDMEKFKPRAVSHDSRGFKMVDYSQVS